MSEWCLLHPWMTFFVAWSAFGIPARIAAMIVYRGRLRKTVKS